MQLSEIYEKLEEVGVLTFSTISGDEVHSRIAHFNGFDDEGIYFRTMANKPYARQLRETGKLTVCGCKDSRILGHDENGAPEFPTSYTIRLIGEVRPVSPKELREKAKNDEQFRMAVYDMERYPAMREGNFVMYKAKGEIFDYDFQCINRDHKLLRTRFEFGGMTYNEAGPIITDRCIECGLCLKGCSFKAIEAGKPYRIISERCDDCGSCMINCPVEAIEASNTF